MRILVERLKAFWSDTRAAVTAEALIVLPFMIWAHLGTYEYFNVFNAIATNAKATYTLADIISRQSGTLTPTMIDNMNNLYGYLNHSPTGTWTRVTCVSWDPNAGTSGQYYVMWSYATGSHLALTDDTLQNYVPKLPTITQGDTLIMVETHMTYVATFSVPGVGTTEDLNQMVITRPRISPQVAFSAS